MNVTQEINKRIAEYNETLTEKVKYLTRENDRLADELAKLKKSAPTGNPIDWAWEMGNDFRGGNMNSEFRNIEMASRTGRPVYIFDVESLTAPAVRGIEYLIKNGWNLDIDPASCDRPFPLEHDGVMTIAAKVPPESNAIKSLEVRPVDFAKWEEFVNFTILAERSCWPVTNPTSL